jgi:hypothetical protein
MSGEGKWDFGPEEAQSSDEIERALQRVTKNGQRRKTIRRSAGLGSVASVLALLIGGLIYGANSAVLPHALTAGSNHATSTTASPSTTVAPKPSDGRPKIMVAYGATGQTDPVSGAKYGLVRLDPQTGAVLKVLDANATSTSVQLSPDGETVYYDSADGGGCPSIYKVPSDGGKPIMLQEHVTDPVLSIDGKYLAFTTDCGTYASDASNPSIVSQSLEVMNLATGKAHSIAEVRASAGTTFGELMWSGDGKYVASAVITADGPEPTQDTYWYDASVTSPVNQYGDVSTKSFNPPGFEAAAGSQQPEWATYQSLTNGAVLASTFCCNASAPTGNESVALVKDGHVANVIATLKADGQSTPVIADAVSDSKGQYFAYTARNPDPNTNDLWILDKGESKAVLLAHGVNLVAWR